MDFVAQNNSWKFDYFLVSISGLTGFNKRGAAAQCRSVAVSIGMRLFAQTGTVPSLGNRLFGVA